MLFLDPAEQLAGAPEKEKGIRLRIPYPLIRKSPRTPAGCPRESALTLLGYCPDAACRGAGGNDITLRFICWKACVSVVRRRNVEAGVCASMFWMS